MLRHEFNQNILGSRIIPPTPENLADRIIAKARAVGGENNIIMMLVMPRPFLVMTILFVLSFAAGFGMDFGFNSIENLMVDEQDILYLVDNNIYVETL